MSEQPARRPRRPHERPDAPDGEAALEIAARFLATRPRTRWEVERRLRRARADPSVTTLTLDHLVGLGLVDDAAFARWWIEQRDQHAPRGRRLIEAELRQHGVPREVIESLRDADLTEPPSGAGGVTATEPDRARIALERHLRGRPMPGDRQAVQRLRMFLMRRGFDPETVRTTLRAAADTLGEVGE